MQLASLSNLQAFWATQRECYGDAIPLQQLLNASEIVGHGPSGVKDPSKAVNTFVFCIHSRQPHSGDVPYPPLSPSANLGGRTVSPSGSFLSTMPRLRSASFTFGSPGKVEAPESRQQQKRRHSLSLDPGGRTPSDAWNGDDGTPNLLQPQQQQQTQLQHTQQQSRRSGRLAGLRKALRRMGRATKEKLRRLWRGIRRGASRAKRAMKRAAAAIYKKLPKLRKLRRQSEGAEGGAAASGLVGAGLAGAAAGLGPGEEGPGEENPKGAETPKNPEIATPVSGAVSTASAEAEETAAPPAEAAAPSSAVGEESQEVEEWHEALTPEQVEEASEEWHDAVTPEELDILLARARTSEKVQEKTAETNQVSDKPEDPGISPECVKYYRRMTTVMKQLNREWRGHCMFWSLFMKNGNFGTFVDSMQDVAVQTGASIRAAEKLTGTEEGIDAQLLRMTLVLALAEEAVAKAADQTQENCWFVDSYRWDEKTTRDEMEVLNSLHPVHFFANPLKFTRPLHRLIKSVYADTAKCFSSALGEAHSREDLQQILMSEKQNLEATMKELGHTLSHRQRGGMEQVMEELEKLYKREFCSIEQTHLQLVQARLDGDNSTARPELLLKDDENTA
ncbi:hypothetical protein, conserved [Eimeria praecox]|uniref:Uncharacterized protein n=1 Tax=Eimeria praecox TaxID=51316 RepID=U6H3Z5_9EIME|nr:hypothetical protein, conserved [Eimeria praecox]